MKYVRKELSIDECGFIMNSDGSINVKTEIGFKRDLRSINENEKSLIKSFFRLRKYSRKEKKKYNDFFMTFFVLPLVVKKRINELQ